MTLELRYMTFDDVPQVVAIDQEAFVTPWPARSYMYEIGESTYSYMLVLDQSNVQPVQGWRRLIRGLNGSSPTTEVQHEIIGYGGLWNIMDEAHISTIATHEHFRGQGFGELMLVTLIRRARSLNARYIVLEVRLSNTTAQRLYQKYGFEIAGTKRGYYSDNGEDAYDMRLQLDDVNQMAHFEARYQSLVKNYQASDTFSSTSRPKNSRRTR